MDTTVDRIRSKSKEDRVFALKVVYIFLKRSRCYIRKFPERFFRLKKRKMLSEQLNKKSKAQNRYMLCAYIIML